MSILYLPAETFEMANSPLELDLENLKRVESLCLVNETTALERLFFSSVSDTLPLTTALCAKAGSEAVMSTRIVSSFLIAGF